MQIKKLAVAAAAVGALGVSLLTAVPASADYSPGPSDVVGVGSDTVQNAIDFMVDGDYLGNNGYNFGQKNKVVNFDATPEANARLGYGTGGLSGQCAPGTGTTKATGNQNGTHADTYCTLNATIVLRSGTRPVQRPNGSGAGYTALTNDFNNGTNLISFTRSSSPRGAKTGIDSLVVGTDDLAMLSTSSGSNMVAALTVDQLASIYSCTTTTWAALGAPFTSTDRIIPIAPQIGSGTRDAFLRALNKSTSVNLPTGPCVINAEENDPEAIDALQNPAYATGNTGSPQVNAIEPMSSGRLALYKGLAPDLTTQLGAPYFNDPSCEYGNITTAGCFTSQNFTATAPITTNVLTIPGLSAETSLKINDLVSGTGIAAQSAVTALSDDTVNTLVTISQNTSAAVAGTVTFKRSGNALAPNVKFWNTGTLVTNSVQAASTPTVAVTGASLALTLTVANADLTKFTAGFGGQNGSYVTGTGVGSGAQVVSVGAADSAGVGFGTVTLSAANTAAVSSVKVATNQLTFTDAGQCAALTVGQYVSGPNIVGSSKILAANAAVPCTILIEKPIAGTIGAGQSIVVSGAFYVTRSLFVYFRDSDINLTSPFQPGSIRNWVRTLFYNPCGGVDANGVAITSGRCVSGGTYGPGGAPYLSGIAPGLIAAAGIPAPTSYTFTPNGA